jgi:uncharacterized protein (UPF0333 family)
MSKLKTNQKGQAAAPFELLVAIIIMTFVIIVGTQMLNRVNEQVCINHVESEMSKFVNYLEETANKKTTNQFIFSPQTSCFNQSSHEMKIVRGGDIRVCSAKCGISQDTCYIMIFYTPDVSLGFKERCVNLPVFTNFETADSICTTTGDLAGYSVIVPGEKIPFGSYILKNVARVGETWPSICFYKK